jgi:hypothetical protein
MKAAAPGLGSNTPNTLALAPKRTSIHPRKNIDAVDAEYPKPRGYRLSTETVYIVIIAAVVLGCCSIGTACYNWIGSQSFGTTGMVLCLVGVVLFGTATWASVEVGKSADNRAIQQTIEDGNAKAIAATQASNKQLADQLQRSTKQLQDNQDRALGDMQKHVLAIRTAIAERPAPALQFPADTSAPTATPKRQPQKTR